MKKIGVFVSEKFQFLEVKFSIYLNRSVFVMSKFSSLAIQNSPGKILIRLREYAGLFNIRRMNIPRVHFLTLWLSCLWLPAFYPLQVALLITSLLQNKRIQGSTYFPVLIDPFSEEDKTIVTFLHHENTPIQIFWEFYHHKTKTSIWKYLVVFIFLLKT